MRCPTIAYRVLAYDVSYETKSKLQPCWWLLEFVDIRLITRSGDCVGNATTPGCVLSEHKRRAATAVMDVAVVVAMTMNNGAVIERRRMRSTIM